MVMCVSSKHVLSTLGFVCLPDLFLVKSPWSQILAINLVSVRLLLEMIRPTKISKTLREENVTAGKEEELVVHYNEHY